MNVLTERIAREIESVPEPVLAEVLDFVLFLKARNSGNGDLPAVRKTPGVCGGEACIRRTRIAVWMLEEARRAGVSDPELLSDYPDLGQDDLSAAWEYVANHRDEIESAISANHAA